MPHSPPRHADSLAWLRRAAEDPAARHPTHLPAWLDLRPHAALFLSVYHAAPAGTEPGFPIVLVPAGLHFPEELAAHSRYPAVIESGRFIGTFHAHPADRPPFFDPQDLAAALRSDNPGFLELLLARDRLYALVRANPFLYISAHHVNRNPLLLAEEHAGLVRAAGGGDPGDAGYDQRYRRAGMHWFHRYQLALYEGAPGSPLQRTRTPPGRW